MNVKDLNSRFGAPGRIVFRDGHCGYPEVVLSNQYGSAEVALLGANVLSYRLANRDLLFVRPSGTEPKIKVYYMLEAKDKAEAIEKCNCYQAEMERVFR